MKEYDGIGPQISFYITFLYNLTIFVLLIMHYAHDQQTCSLCCFMKKLTLYTQICNDYIASYKKPGYKIDQFYICTVSNNQTNNYVNKIEKIYKFTF